jgi:hypothetical protein
MGEGKTVEARASRGQQGYFKIKRHYTRCIRIESPSYKILDWTSLGHRSEQNQMCRKRCLLVREA